MWGADPGSPYGTGMRAPTVSVVAHDKLRRILSSPKRDDL